MMAAYLPSFGIIILPGKAETGRKLGRLGGSLLLLPRLQTAFLLAFRTGLILIMAIVANKLDKPLNELRFRSIKEVK